MASLRSFCPRVGNTSLVLAILLSLLAIPAFAISDEPDFRPTLLTLKRVVDRRDEAGLLALVHPEFRVLGRPVFGIPGFKEYWLQSGKRGGWDRSLPWKQ